MLGKQVSRGGGRMKTADWSVKWEMGEGIASGVKLFRGEHK